MTTIITGIQTGESTHHQLQSITPISFRTIKTTASTSHNPRPFEDESFMCGSSYALPSVEPIPPFLTPVASSEYVTPYGMKIACIKPLPASTCTIF